MRDEKEEDPAIFFRITRHVLRVTKTAFRYFTGSPSLSMTKTSP